ncbi:proline-rich receptor-like protein kinase PERK4 [Hibiscus syriacus]|uniref:proline-rich receptor-like protein kinase PERK4 n=1 Tax=Hibiscus syriacus TaxID=106335 RepID=UPI0019245C85|nr:proline-rich receptor-like protein kinase PERK4 [Hibiscus syriacus]
MAPSPKESPEESPPAPSGSNSSQDSSSPSKNSQSQSPSQSQSQSSSLPPLPEKTSGRKTDSQDSQSYPPPSPPPPPAKKKSGNTHSSPRSSNSHKTNGNKQVGSSGKTPSSNSSENDMDTEIIIIAAVFVGLVLLSMIICIICCCWKRRKKSKEMYYDESKAGGKNYNNHQNSPWVHSGKVPEHAVHVPSPSGGGGGMGGSWGVPPPFYSSEASSQFSGPHHPPPLPPLSPTMALGFNKSTFTYEELLAATNGFSQANLIGQGGFGFVYKGVLPNGKEVVIKTLKTGSGQGEREFQDEVEIISRVHHLYLVSLVGYCIAGGQRMLVYDFVPNKTLEYHLHGHPRIIHRDIKAANILLDNNFDAMVADFGLGKLSFDNYTHVSTRVTGTFVYLAPEYASSGKLTDRSDVFSFGVTLLELITGKQPIDVTMDDSLVDWARPLLARALEDGNFDELVDPRLRKNYNHKEMQRMIASAAASIRHSARKRPKMSQIARILEGDSSLDSLNEGTKPGQSTIFGVSGEYNSSLYNADMQRFRQLAVGSQEFESSEYGTSSGDNSREMGPGGMR